VKFCKIHSSNFFTLSLLPKNHLYLGVNVANTIQLNKPLFSAGLGIQNKKGNILNFSFDTEKRIGFGYYKKLF
jgi:hypothetical protein